MQKNSREGILLGFFIIQFVAENQNNQRGYPFATSRNFGKMSQNAEKNHKAKRSELSTDEKSFENYDTQRWHPLEAPEYAF